MVVAVRDVSVLYHDGNRMRCLGTLPWWWQREMFGYSTMVVAEGDVCTSRPPIPQRLLSSNRHVHTHTHTQTQTKHTHKQTHTHLSEQNPREVFSS